MQQPPSAWGPSTWRALHAITFAYPDEPTRENAASTYALFDSLRDNLPCAECRKHYAQELGSGDGLRAALVSRDALTRWLVALHNRVNARLGKRVVAYTDVLRTYEDAMSCTAACDVEEHAQGASTSRCCEEDAAGKTGPAADEQTAAAHSAPAAAAHRSAAATAAAVREGDASLVPAIATLVVGALVIILVVAWFSAAARRRAALAQKHGGAVAAASAAGADTPQRRAGIFAALGRTPRTPLTPHPPRQRHASD